MSSPVSAAAADAPLPEIPLVDVGADWPLATLDAAIDRAHALLDEGSGHVPAFALRLVDSVSRRWLARWHEPYLQEIDRIAARINRPGAHFLNVSYEWGCTSSACSPADGSPPLLSRVLDWPERGLGRHVIAARIHSAAGRWASLTWPGYTGALQAVAPGRFAAALNQAPMDQPVGLYPLDWLVNRSRVWRQPHLIAAHLLRRVFEQAPDFAAAKAMLRDTPIALPAIYTLAGIRAGETCVIERRPEAAHVIEGPAAAAANAWQTANWSGRPRGSDNVERQRVMQTAQLTIDPSFPWLRRPVLNQWTRLVFVAEAASGAFVAQGYEAEQPVTRALQAVA